jgi:hypothetical protein
MMMRFPMGSREVVTCAVAAAVLCAARPLWAVSLEIEPVAATAGSVVNVCVRMDGSGGQGGIVAGVQMDLVWDENCLTANVQAGDVTACQAEPTTGKDLHQRLLSGNALRAILVSFANTKPIHDGRLFCCGFTVSASPPDSLCSIDMGNVTASDPQGHALSASGQGGVVQIASAPSGGRPAAAVAPIPGAPVVSAPGAAVAPAVGAPGAPAAQPPIGPAPAAPGGQPAGVPGKAPGSEAAPAEQLAAPGEQPAPGATGATGVPTAATTPATPKPTPVAVHTPISTAATPHPTTPLVRLTPTAPPPTSATVGAPSAGAQTPTVKAKSRKHKKVKQRSQ